MRHLAALFAAGTDVLAWLSPFSNEVMVAPTAPEGRLVAGSPGPSAGRVRGVPVVVTEIPAACRLYDRVTLDGFNAPKVLATWALEAFIDVSRDDSLVRRVDRAVL